MDPAGQRMCAHCWWWCFGGAALAYTYCCYVPLASVGRPACLPCAVHLQIEVLRRTLTDMEAANARLQDANTELADSLQQLHEHAQCLEAQLAALKEESAVRVTQLEADAKAAEDSKQKVQAAPSFIIVMLLVERWWAARWGKMLSRHSLTYACG